MFVFVIKEVRESKKISMRNLSKTTGLSRPYLIDLENNKKFNPSLKTMYKIANALDVKIEDLFYTELDIEELKKELDCRVEKYGLHAKEVFEISQIIDLLINVQNRKNIEK